MLELALILACGSGKGCTEATASYFYYRPDLREALHRQEIRISNLVQPLIYQYAAPVIICVARETCSVKLVKDFYLEKQAAQFALVFKVGF